MNWHRPFRNLALTDREESTYRPCDFDGDEIPHPVRWETLERKYLVIVKAAEVAAVLGGDRGPMVECIQHPEWGRMVARDAARHGANTSTENLLAAVRTGRMYAGLHWCKAGQRHKFRPHRNARRQTRVRCVETGEEFPGVIDLAARLGVVPSAVSEAMARRHACRGLHYVRAASRRPFVPAERWCRPVLCVETDRLYPSVADAARAVGCNKGNISSAAARGNRAAKLHWRYPDNEALAAAANNGAAEAKRTHDHAVPSVASLPADSMLQHHHSTRAGDGRDGSLRANIVASTTFAQEGAAA